MPKIPYLLEVWCRGTSLWDPITLCGVIYTRDWIQPQFAVLTRLTECDTLWGRSSLLLEQSIHKSIHLVIHPWCLYIRIKFRCKRKNAFNETDIIYDVVDRHEPQRLTDTLYYDQKAYNPLTVQHKKQNKKGRVSSSPTWIKSTTVLFSRRKLYADDSTIAFFQSSRRINQT